MANKFDAIQSFDELRLSYVLYDIKAHPELYPNNPNEWVSWLNEKIENSNNLFGVLA